MACSATCLSVCVYLAAGCRNLSKVIMYQLARCFVILKTSHHPFNTSHFQFCAVVLKTPTKAQSHITFLALGMKATPSPPPHADETWKYI